jgi:short-subunit dehydrogenase
MAVILIIGASKGIGLETAQLLRQAGHTVIGTCRKPSNDGLLPLDVTDKSSIDHFMSLLQGQVLDGMVYSAGYDLYAAAEDTSMDDLRAQVDANFLGAVRMTRAVLPKLREKGGGKLIFLSSLGGLSALPFNSAYSASKFALEGYVESLRYELIPLNIFASLIVPGQVRTNTLTTSIQSIEQPSNYGVSSLLLAEKARQAGEQAKLMPEEVAQLIVDVIENPRPRLRYLVGTQAKLVVALRTWLPEPLFENFIMRQFVKPILKQS